MMDLGRYGSRDILEAQINDFITKKPLMYFDYANSSSNSWESTQVYATGAGTRRISWSGEKTSTLVFETQIFSMQHLAMLAGEDIVDGTENIFKRELVVVGDDGTGGKQITLKKEPTGAESVSVFPYVNGITVNEPQTITSVTTNTVLLDAASTVVVGDEVEVFYQFQSASSKKLSFTAKGFPKYVEIIGNTIFPDELSGEIVPAQLKYYKAKLQPAFETSFSSTGDPSSLTLTFDIFATQVGGVDTMADIILYEE